MILEKLLNSQKLMSNINEFIRLETGVWDIGIYGSCIRGKFDINDIDIIIILKENKGIKEKLEISQNLKSKLRGLIKFEIDIKCVDLNDLMDENFLARSGILSETFLIKHNKNLSEIFGFKPYYLFIYTLEGLTKSKKQLFLYALNGRNNSTGLIKSKRIEHLGRGILNVPLEFSEEIKEFLETNNIKYKIKRILTY